MRKIIKRRTFNVKGIGDGFPCHPIWVWNFIKLFVTWSKLFVTVLSKKILSVLVVNERVWKPLNAISLHSTKFLKTKRTEPMRFMITGNYDFDKYFCSWSIDRSLIKNKKQTVVVNILNLHSFGLRLEVSCDSTYIFKSSCWNLAVRGLEPRLSKYLTVNYKKKN